MVTRRNLLGAVGGAGLIALVPALPAQAADTTKWRRKTSANGWTIDPGAIAGFRIEGSRASIDLRAGIAAAVLLHITRRWHYEIAPLDTEEGGTATGHSTKRAVGAKFESNYLSSTAMSLRPDAYPLGGSEKLWPHQIEIVRDILLDCEGTVAWGGDLKPAKASHFHIGVRPDNETLARVAARLATGNGQTARPLTISPP